VAARPRCRAKRRHGLQPSDDCKDRQACDGRIEPRAIGLKLYYHRVLARSERARVGGRIDHEIDPCSDCFCCLGYSDFVDTSSDFLVYSIGKSNEREGQLRRRRVY
jgi:hypothetical protein